MTFPFPYASGRPVSGRRLPLRASAVRPALYAGGCGVVSLLYMRGTVRVSSTPPVRQQNAPSVGTLRTSDFSPGHKKLEDMPRQHILLAVVLLMAGLNPEWVRRALRILPTLIRKLPLRNGISVVPPCPSFLDRKVCTAGTTTP